MQEKQNKFSGGTDLKVQDRKKFLSLGLIIVSITALFALSFHMYTAKREMTKVPECGGLLSGDNGEFEYSPAQSRNSPKTCVWLIHAYDGSEMHLTLQVLKGKEGSSVVLYKEGQPGQIHLEPLVLSTESVGKTVDIDGSTILIVLPQADSSSISFKWDSAPDPYVSYPLSATIAQYVETVPKMLSWQPRRSQERLWWIIGGGGNELPSEVVAYETKRDQPGCAQPCECVAFQAFQINSDGFLMEIARDCGGKASSGKFKVDSFPLVIAASANTTVQGATRVELRWAPGREATQVPSTAGLVTNGLNRNAPLSDGAEIYFSSGYTRGSEIKAFSVASSTVRSVVNTTNDAEAIAYDPDNQEIFYSSRETIYCMSVTDVHRVRKVFTSEEGYFFSLAFDHLNGLLYGLTSGGYVVACGRTPTRGMNNSSGWTCIKILNGSTDDTYESPIYFSIALRPSNGEMYLGTYRGGLLRAQMDGSNVTTFVNETETRFNGLVVDENASQLYWTDQENNRIQRTRLDGRGGVETVIQLNEWIGPRDMTKAYDKLYWNSVGYDSLRAVTVRGEDLRVAHNASNGIIGLAVVAPKDHYGSGQVGSRCEGRGCSHMCVPTARSFRCLCPEGMYLLGDSKTCVDESP